MNPKIQFWFEFASTYSYPSVMRIEELAKQSRVEIEWKPFLLGPIFQAQGWNDSPFNLYPAKGKYMWRDLERLCEHYQIAFRKPSQFPRSGVLAAKITCANQKEPWCADFVKKVFQANFEKDLDISKKEVIVSILKSMKLSLKIIDQSLSVENKNRLREQTEQAMKLEIFGAPTFIVDQEMFWGDDRLEMAIEWCQQNSPSYIR